MSRRKKKGRGKAATGPTGCISQEPAPSVAVEHPDSILVGEGSADQSDSRTEERSAAHGDSVTPSTASLELEGKSTSTKNNKRCAITQETPSTPVPSNKSSFEGELEWCIAQLELGMLRTGATKSQKQQNGRSLQTLRGTKTPLPKKRQLMRNLFGDYRSKMKTQPIPENRTKEAKVEAAKSETIETVGTYYRQRTHRVCTQEGGEEFRFNFVGSDIACS